MLTTLLFLLSSIGCVEPPPSTVQGPNEPSGAAKPGAPAPDEGATIPTDNPTVPAPHDGSTPHAPVPEFTQEALADGVELAVTLECADCKGTLLVRIEDASTNPPTLLTQTTTDKTGPMTIRAPRDKQVILMVVDDVNDNGQPTPGEGIGIWTGGLLDTSAPPDDLKLEVGVVPETPPIPPSEENNNTPEAIEAAQGTPVAPAEGDAAAAPAAGEAAPVAPADPAPPATE